MSRVLPYIEVKRKHIESWLQAKGWKPVFDQKFPFMPPKYQDPNKDQVLWPDAAVEIQMIRETTNL